MLLLLLGFLPLLVLNAFFLLRLLPRPLLLR